MIIVSHTYRYLAVWCLLQPLEVISILQCLATL